MVLPQYRTHPGPLAPASEDQRWDRKRSLSWVQVPGSLVGVNSSVDQRREAQWFPAVHRQAVFPPSCLGLSASLYRFGRSSTGLATTLHSQMASARRRASASAREPVGQPDAARAAESHRCSEGRPRRRSSRLLRAPGTHGAGRCQRDPIPATMCWRWPSLATSINRQPAVSPSPANWRSTVEALFLGGALSEGA